MMIDIATVVLLGLCGLFSFAVFVGLCAFDLSVAFKNDLRLRRKIATALIQSMAMVFVSLLPLAISAFRNRIFLYSACFASLAAFNGGAELVKRFVGELDRTRETTQSAILLVCEVALGVLTALNMYYFYSEVLYVNCVLLATIITIIKARMAVSARDVNSRA